MAITDIDVGTVANDGTGQTLRAAFQRVNSNYDEFYKTDTIIAKLVTISPAGATPTNSEITALLGIPLIVTSVPLYLLSDSKNSCIWLCSHNTNVWCLVKLSYGV